MRICSIACVMDSHQLLAASIGHLALNGIKDFYLYDHGSEPDLSSFLSREFPSGDLHFRVLRKDSVAFFQRAMVNALATLAQLDGFDVVVPFDADEFWCSTVDGRTLAEQIAAELREDVDALRIPVLNYAQHQDVETFELETLLQCQYAVTPFTAFDGHPQDQVAAGMPFVAMPFPSKIAPWLTHNLEIHEGQHGVSKPEGDCVIVEATGLVVRHLPIPSKAHVIHRKKHGQRRKAGGYAPEVGWQSQQLIESEVEALHAYWRNNAWHLSRELHPQVGTYRDLTQDDALVQIGHRLIATRNARREAPAGNMLPSSSVVPVPPDHLMVLVQNLIDAVGAGERQHALLTRQIKATLAHKLRAIPRRAMRDLRRAFPGCFGAEPETGR